MEVYIALHIHWKDWMELLVHRNFWCEIQVLSLCRWLKFKEQRKFKLFRLKETKTEQLDKPIVVTSTELVFTYLFLIKIIWKLMYNTMLQVWRWTLKCSSNVSKRLVFTLDLYNCKLTVERILSPVWKITTKLYCINLLQYCLLLNYYILFCVLG